MAKFFQGQVLSDVLCHFCVSGSETKRKNPGQLLFGLGFLLLAGRSAGLERISVLASGGFVEPDRQSDGDDEGGVVFVGGVPTGLEVTRCGELEPGFSFEPSSPARVDAHKELPMAAGE